MNENIEKKANYKFIKKNTYNFINEPIGDTQPKYWFIPKAIFSEEDAIDEKNKGQIFLVKRGNYAKGAKNRRRSFRQNCVGEYVGYRIAKLYEDEINEGKTEKERFVCPVELICFNTRDTRDGRKSGSTLFPACASERLMVQNDILDPAESFIEQFKNEKPDKYNEILDKSEKYGRGKHGKSRALQSNGNEDCLEIGLAALEYKIREFEEKNNIDKKITEQDIKDSRKNFFRMCIYDLLTGNNDRHTNNYSLILKADSHRAYLYPMYDNERILGFYNSKYELDKIYEKAEETTKKRIDTKKSLSKVSSFKNPEEELEKNTEAVFKSSLNELQSSEQFSRMGVGSINSGSDYRDVTNYLISKYPDEVIPIIKQMTKVVTPQNVSKILDEFEGIEDRTKQTKTLKEKIEDEDGKCSPKILDEDKKVLKMFKLPKSYKNYANLIISKRYEYITDRVRQYERENEEIDK